MTTIERNYKKNPHTARWLMTFHAAGLPADRDDNQAEYDLAQAEDLLDLVPENAPAVDRRSPAQADLMGRLIAQITELDATLGAAAGEWTAKATAAGHWTPGREGNASEWISKMIAKVSELKAQHLGTSPEVTVTVPDGRYAVEEDGVLRFFKVKNGRRAGFVFLDIQASDDWHAIRNVARIRAIVALIAQDTEEASLRYGRELGVCGDCGRTLTDESSRARGRGPICDAKH